MKTLILYASKYGGTKEIARRIAGKLENAVVFDLKGENPPSLSDFDCVIIGSSVYAGSIRKEARAYMSQYALALGEKTLGLFLSGFAENKSCFEQNFPPDILRAAKATAFLGGVFDPEKAGMLERFIVRIVVKQTQYADRIDDEKINGFVEAIRSCLKT